MEMDEHRLLIEAHRGGRDAAVRLYARMAPRLLAYARALLGHDAAAEDAVQQVFLRVLALPGREVEQVQDATAWLVRLTRNIALNDVRARRRAKVREGAAAGVLPGGDRASGEEGSQEELLQAVGRLSEQARELVLLKHVAGLTFEQMALSLGENRNTVASRYRAAVGELRSILAPASKKTAPEPAASEAEGLPHG